MKQIKEKTKLMLKIENKFNLSVEELLRQKFVDENKSTPQVAKDIGIGYMTAFDWLKKAGIYSRRLKI